MAKVWYKTSVCACVCATSIQVFLCLSSRVSFCCPPDVLFLRLNIWRLTEFHWPGTFPSYLDGTTRFLTGTGSLPRLDYAMILFASNPRGRKDVH